MALVEIPIDPTLESQRFSSVLDGARFELEFAFNPRGEAWNFSIALDDGEPLIGGAKILPSWDPFFGIRREGMPPGTFVVLDREETGIPPGVDELGVGRRVRLLYDEAA